MESTLVDSQTSSTCINIRTKTIFTDDATNGNHSNTSANIERWSPSVIKVVTYSLCSNMKSSHGFRFYGEISICSKWNKARPLASALFSNPVKSIAFSLYFTQQQLKYSDLNYIKARTLQINSLSYLRHGTEPTTTSSHSAQISGCVAYK
jgi:hypothetical protein